MFQVQGSNGGEREGGACRGMNPVMLQRAFDTALGSAEIMPFAWASYDLAPVDGPESIERAFPFFRYDVRATAGKPNAEPLRFTLQPQLNDRCLQLTGPDLIKTDRHAPKPIPDGVLEEVLRRVLVVGRGLGFRDLRIHTGSLRTRAADLFLLGFQNVGPFAKAFEATLIAEGIPKKTVKVKEASRNALWAFAETALGGRLLSGYKGVVKLDLEGQVPLRRAAERLKIAPALLGLGKE